MRKKIKLVINTILGLFLYVVSPSFRATIRAKSRGANEPVATGETVIAVIKRADGSVRVIGEKR